ncbi:hypothetical protein CQ14_06670 [Bradyrhizobium lablabi]|uniref:PD-(D/E)XK endonuclease-like domain-containing protein n=1 Tax=Bradyrhizobium lablabi TaxID=722472 RepID=A0A0R3MT26_9BRAD|nr:hypothetical protein [Bradyrhizobium lablabi]KRR21327.1 hypothetical protein CQ14_06670 [Bradyrhizobium lablabi]
MLDFNPPLSTELNNALNAVLDTAAQIREREEQRDYLGASAIGSECLRKVQFDWMRDSVFPARTRRIFDRGHASEEKIAASFKLAGFELERGTARCEYSTADGSFKGHCDGILHNGPRIGLKFPCLWENKCLGSSGWKKIEKYGLRASYPVYYDQCQLYMAYLGLDENPALFTAENADTCHLLAVLVDFDAAAAQAASDRAAHIIRATRAGELLPRITEKGPDDWRCKMCSHSPYCWSLNH